MSVPGEWDFAAEWVAPRELQIRILEVQELRGRLDRTIDALDEARREREWADTERAAEADRAAELARQVDDLNSRNTAIGAALDGWREYASKMQAEVNAATELIEAQKKQIADLELRNVALDDKLDGATIEIHALQAAYQRASGDAHRANANASILADLIGKLDATLDDTTRKVMQQVQGGPPPRIHFVKQCDCDTCVDTRQRINGFPVQA